MKGAMAFTSRQLVIAVNLVVVVLGLGACTPSAAVDGGMADAGPAIECHPNLPEPSHPCLAGQCGNALGVGQPCTPGGGECGDFAVLADGSVGALFCTADFNPTDLWYCTKPCGRDEDCGEGPYNCTNDEDDPGSSSGCFVTACYDAEGEDGGLGEN